MKRILIAPIIACLIIAIIDIFFGDGFRAFLWLAVSFLFSITLLPAVFSMDDKNVPVMQIFFTLFFFVILFAIAAFFDFKQAGFVLERALLYGVGIGLGTMAAIMLIKGQK